MKPIITILLFLILFQAKAQEKKYTQNLLTATILSPGISYEIAAGKKITAKLNAFVFPGFSYSQNILLNGRSNFSFEPTPLLVGEGRYYYNFQQRLKKEKNISRNSANYLGVSGKYGVSIKTFYPDNGNAVRTARQIYDAGIVWGLQRNYNNRFSLDLNIGPSILQPLIDKEFGLISNLSLGIWLGKRTD